MNPEQERLVSKAKRDHDLGRELDSDARRARVGRDVWLGRAYEAGVTIPELATELGISAEMVSKILGRPRNVARGVS